MKSKLLKIKKFIKTHNLINKWTIFFVLYLIILIFVIIVNHQKSLGTETTTDYEYTIYDEKSSSDYIFDDTKELGLEIVLPYHGYQTGLSDFPTLRWEDKVIIGEGSRVDINVHYPEFLGEDNVIKLNEYIKTFATDYIKKDELEYKELINEGPETLGQYLSLSIGYRIIGVQNGIVSMELVTVDFTGGGNGNHDYPYIINWDLKTDKLLNPQQLFCKSNYLSTIAPIAQKKILDRIPEDFDFGGKEVKDLSTDEKDILDRIIEVIKDGTEPDLGNYDNLLPYKGGLIVVFAPYQVHSGASGIVRTYIPESKIPNLICLP